MKRIWIFLLVVVSFLYLFSPLAIADTVVAVRDAFKTENWFVFTTRDNVFWTRFHYARQYTTVEVDELGWGMVDVQYGRVWEGSWQNRDDDDSGQRTGTWVEDDFETNWPVLRSTEASTLQYTIPQGHNRVHLLIQENKGATIDWADSTTTGIDLTTVPATSTGAGVQEWELATNTTKTSAGAVNIRISVGSSVRIIGVRSWNTAVPGDPTTNTAGLATGHDLVTKINEDFDNKKTGEYEGILANQSWSVLKDGTWEFAINWQPDAGGGFKWTSLGGHSNPATDAVYANTLGSGSLIAVDGVFLGTDGEMSDIADIPAKTVLSGDTATIINEGFADHNGDGNNDATDFAILCLTGFSNTGVTCDVNFDFGDAAEVTSFYVGMLELDSGANADVVIEGDSTVYRLNETSEREIVFFNKCTLQRDFVPTLILNTSSVTEHIRMRDTTAEEPKLYMSIATSGMLPGAVAKNASTSDVAANSNWSAYCRTEFQATPIPDDLSRGRYSGSGR